MANIIDCTTAIILNKNREFLLQKKDQYHIRAPGKWCTFGGGIEPGESPNKAIRRELQEELGCQIDKLQFYKKAKYQYSNARDAPLGDIYIYLGKFNRNVSDISLGEGAGFAFFSSIELKSLDIEEFNRKTIEEFLRKFKIL